MRPRQLYSLFLKYFFFSDCCVNPQCPCGKHVVWAWRETETVSSLIHWVMNQYRVTNTCQSLTRVEKYGWKDIFFGFKRKSESFNLSAHQLCEMFETFFEFYFQQVSMVILLSFGHLYHSGTNDSANDSTVSVKK